MEFDELLDHVIVRAQRDSERKQDRSKRTHQQILDAALRIFSRDGISRARIGDIAAEAGVSASTLYEYYKGKEDLAYEVPMSYLARFYEEYRQEVAGVTSAYDRLALYLSLSADFARQHAEWARLFYLEIWPSVFVNETALRHSVDDFARLVVHLIGEGERQGEWPPGHDPYQTAAIVLGGVNQIIITWLLYRRPRNLTKASVEMVTRILRMLKNEDGAQVTKRATRRRAKAAPAA